MEVNLDDPSHEEIWDDSMLINSWNEALQEYKKYHSIHAKGGSVRDLGKESSEPSSKTRAQSVSAEAQAQQEVEVEDFQETQMNDEEEEPSTAKPTNQQSSQTASTSNDAMPPAFPSQAVLGSVRDDNLKKLLMSWYYAGYYTGLYEGQQQAQQQQP